MKPTPACFTAPTVRPRYFNKLNNAKAVTLPPQAGFVSALEIGPDITQQLPSVAAHVGAPSAPFAAGPSTFRFCDEGFVIHFIMADQVDYSIMYAAYLLLSYAHFTALTGSSHPPDHCKDGLFRQRIESSVFDGDSGARCSDRLSGLARSPKTSEYAGIHPCVNAGGLPMLSRIRGNSTKRA